jgi:16S rRNA (cytosine1402-N4)-methyltransferase
MMMTMLTQTTMASVHKSVLADETMRVLAIEVGETVVDCTGGGGGHAERFADAAGSTGRVIVLDRDPAAIERLRARFAARSEIECVQANFADLGAVLAGRGLNGADVIFADLGWSSDQVEDAARGFSFQRPGPIDMRFDPSTGHAAERIVNRMREDDLADLIFQLGDERYSRRIAAAIVKSRPINDTVTLAEVIRRAVPRGSPKLDRATRTFQALRISTNREMEALDELLEKGIDLLRPGGRMAIIAFHSLEAKRVKAAFRGAEKDGRVSLLTRKPLFPTRAEVADNPRSRSAVLRGVIRLDRSGGDSEGESHT